MRAGARRSARAGTLGVALVALLGSPGCAGFWEDVRERERQSAASHAQELVAARRCERALASLERAQAGRELGAFAARSVELRARCLAELGRTEEARAHWRLLADFYSDLKHRPAVSSPPDAGALPALSPTAVVVPEPRYSRSAMRSRISGTVVVAYVVNERARIEEIQVVEPAHPLLAAFAIEAVARVSLTESAATPLPARGVLSFRFERPWNDTDG